MISELLQKLLGKNRNDPQVKETIKQKVSKVESITYHLMSSDQEQQFMQEYARVNIQQERLQDVSQLALDRFSRVAESIERGELILPDQQIQTQPQPPKSTVTADQALTVQLRNREEYPIAANFDYWSINHSKSIEVREYMSKLHEQDRKIKQQLRSKKLAVQQAKRRRLEQQQHQESLLEQQRKQEIKQQAISKIKQLEEDRQHRSENEKKFREFYQQYRGKSPLHVKMQKEFREKFQMPLLTERKAKLQLIRSIRKQPSLTQLQEHMRKHDESMQAHQAATITNQPVKVSYRSRYHSTLDPHSQEQDTKELYEKKLNYGKKVREEFKPVISPRLAEEIQQRFEPKDPLSKRRQKSKKPANEDSEENEDDDDENEVKPKPAKPNEEGSDEDDDDDEDSEAENKKREPSQQPQCAYRNKLGNNYLDFVRKLKKKNRLTKQDYIRRIQQEERLEAESKKRVIRPNYLEDLRSHNRSYSVTAKSPFDNWQSDLQDSRLNEIDKKRRVFMKSQQITEKAQRRELEIAHNKLTQNQLLQQRQKVDLQYLEAIRAKLALMQV